MAEFYENNLEPAVAAMAEWIAEEFGPTGSGERAQRINRFVKRFALKIHEIPGGTLLLQAASKLSKFKLMRWIRRRLPRRVGGVNLSDIEHEAIIAGLTAFVDGLGDRLGQTLNAAEIESLVDERIPTTPPPAPTGPTGTPMPPTPAATAATPAAGHAEEEIEIPAEISRLHAAASREAKEFLSWWFGENDRARGSDRVGEELNARKHRTARKRAYWADVLGVILLVESSITDGLSREQIADLLDGNNDIYVVKDRKEDVAGDFGDTLVDGSTTRWIGRFAKIGVILGVSAPVLIAFTFVGAIIALGGGGGWCIFIGGKEGLTALASNASLGSAMGYTIGGCLLIFTALFMVDTFRDLVLVSAKQLGAPFRWLQQIIESIFAARGVTITNTNTPANAEEGDH